MSNLQLRTHRSYVERIHDNISAKISSLLLSINLPSSVFLTSATLSDPKTFDRSDNGVDYPLGPGLIGGDLFEDAVTVFSPPGLYNPIVPSDLSITGTNASRLSALSPDSVGTYLINAIVEIGVVPAGFPDPTFIAIPSGDTVAWSSVTPPPIPAPIIPFSITVSFTLTDPTLGVTLAEFASSRQTVSSTERVTLSFAPSMVIPLNSGASIGLQIQVNGLDIALFGGSFTMDGVGAIMSMTKIQ